MLVVYGARSPEYTAHDCVYKRIGQSDNTVPRAIQTAVPPNPSGRRRWPWESESEGFAATPESY